MVKEKQKSAGFMAAAHKSLRQMIISREFLRGGRVLLSAEMHPGARIFLKTGRRASGAAMFNMAKNNTRYGILVFVFCTKIRDNGDNKIPGMENFPESETE